MLKKFEFYFHFVEFYSGVWLCCATDIGHWNLIIPPHMQFSVRREQKTWVFSAHAVMILILLYTWVGKLSDSLGRRQRSYRTSRDHMLRQGAGNKRGMDTRHTWGPWAYLCTRIRRVPSKPHPPPWTSKHRRWAESSGTYKSGDYKLRACGGWELH